MKHIKRLSMKLHAGSAFMNESSEGKYVRYIDVKDLIEENKELKERLKAAMILALKDKL